MLPFFRRGTAAPALSPLSVTESTSVLGDEDRPEALAHTPSLAPALVRRLDHATMVKRLGSRLVIGVVALASFGGLGAGIPAYANSVVAEAEVAVPEVQTLRVASDAAPPAPARDAYTVITPPALQYPLLTGTGITSGYGMRGGRMHNGADIFPGYGTPVHTIAAGTVIGASGGGDYGNHVTVEHQIAGQKVVSVYAHLAPGTMTVSAGQTVYVGQVIGAVGQTGNAQGAHLHFEVRPGGGAPVSPYPWIAARL